MIGKLLCRFNRHDWNLILCRVGEHQHCRTPGCNAVAYATPRGWVLPGKGLLPDTAPRRRSG